MREYSGAAAHIREHNGARDTICNLKRPEGVAKQAAAHSEARCCLESGVISHNGACVN
jgi:hypothetical protein